MASRVVIYAAVAVLVVVASFSGYYFLKQNQGVQPPPTGNATSITIYGGEVSASIYGFGFTASNLTSPGPTLNLTVGSVYKLTFVDVGQFPHAIVIKMANSPAATTLWNAYVGTASNPLVNGQSGSVTFTPDQSGTFYYLCPVPGHDDLGMWGLVKVT